LPICGRPVGLTPESKVFLSVEGEELSIKCGRFTATIQGLTGAEFPAFPKNCSWPKTFNKFEMGL